MPLEAHMKSDATVIDITPVAAIAAGEIVVHGDLVGIANAPIAANTPGAIAISGEVEVPKTSANTFTAGALVYWDDTANEATSTSTGNTLMGRAAQAYGAGDTAMRVLLNWTT